MTFPTDPAPSSVRVGSIQPTRRSVAHSRKAQRRGGTVQQWTFTYRWQRVKRSRLAPIIAAAIALRGGAVTTTIIPPVLGTRQATGGGIPFVKTTTATGRSIPVKGVTPGATLGKALDLVKFANHTKVYTLTADAVADGSGDVTLSIEPALYAGVTADEAVSLEDVPVTVYCATDVREFDILDGVDVPIDFELEFVEDV